MPHSSAFLHADRDGYRQKTLPLGPLAGQLGFLLGQCHWQPYSDGIRARVLDSLIHALFAYYLDDPEANAWYRVFNNEGSLSLLDVHCTDLLVRMTDQLHRLFQTTVGPLMPSMRYEYIVRMAYHEVILIPKIPTADYHLARVAALATDDDAWIPTRHRAFASV
jgi:hypothetical protein